MPVLPAFTLQDGDIVVGQRIADAEIADEGPALWHAQDFRDARRIHNRDPADPEPFRPSRNQSVWIAMATE